MLEAATQRSGWQWLNGALAAAFIQQGDEAALRRLLAEAPVPEDARAALTGLLDDPADADALARLTDELRRFDFSAANADYFLAESVLLRSGHLALLIDYYSRQIAARGALQDDYWFLPAYAPLRAHPDFAGLLELAGLPAYWDQAGWPEHCRREAGAINCE